MRAWLLVICLAANPVFAAAEQAPGGLLEKVAVAARRLNYSGTFYFQQDDKVANFKIVHLSDSSGEHEKLTKLDGPPREIVRNNEEVQCYFPGGKQQAAEKIVFRRSFPALLPEQIATLEDNYSISKGEVERVAGLDGQVYRLVPKDNYRYGHKLVVEVNSGLLLRAAMLGEDDKVLEQTSFSALTIGGNVDRASLQPTLAVKLVAASHDQPPVESSGWEVSSLPPGFSKVAEMKRMFRGKSDPVTHLVYSDGIVSVSVFIEALGGDDKPRTGLTRYGAINLYAHPMEHFLATVVGEVPQATVERIGNSVVYRGK